MLFSDEVYRGLEHGPGRRLRQGRGRALAAGYQRNVGRHHRGHPAREGRQTAKEALDGAAALPAKFKGITRVWVKSIKVQGGKNNAIVMEFADEAALKAYTDSDAQKEWYKVYLPIRKSSTTFDITN